MAAEPAGSTENALLGCCVLIGLALVALVTLSAALSIIRGLLGLPDPNQTRQRDEAMQQRMSDLESRIRDMERRGRR